MPEENVVEGAADTGLTPDQEQDRLKAIEREYHVTIRVVAVLAETVATLAKGRRVEITDEMLADSPTLTAWRDEVRGAVIIEVSR